MKRLLANTIMLVGGLTASSQLLALGLGELTLQSALNQPLKAEINLVDSDGLSKWEIKPSLATAGDFERAGVDRLYFLTKIKFQVEGDKVVLTSREPVNEPFLNFLVELNWPSGRVLREYTVLLDPPTFAEQEIRPLVNTPQGNSITSQTPAQEEYEIEPAQQESHLSRWETEPAAPGTYKVQPNDTLWEIALQTRTDRSISAQQMMLAIQDQNPDAFIGGNINRLKTHQVLRIPDAEAVREISMARAVAEVNRQNHELSGAAQLDATGRAGQSAAVKGGADGGEVRLLSAESDNAESAGASGDSGLAAGDGRQQALENELAIALENVDKSRRENQELRERLEALEEQINTLQRLMSLKDDQLAIMQVEGAEDAAAEEAQADAGQAETEAVAPATGTAAVAETGESAADEEAAEDEAAVDFNYAEGAEEPVAAEEDAAANAEKEAAEAAARRARIAAMMAEQEEALRAKPTLVDEMMQNPQIPLAGLGILALIGVLIARVLKKRKPAEKEEQEEFAADDVAFAETEIDNDSLEDFDFDEDELAAAGSDSEGLEDLDLGDIDEHDQGEYETVAQTEDVISESDIYIAYGKFDQAIELLQDAIEKEPSRSDLRLKLLEVYVEMDEAGAFADAEGELQKLGDRQANEQAELLRSRLSAPLAPVAAAAAATGLSLDDEIPSLDDSVSDDFSDGLDFGDALDLSEDLGDEPVLASDDEVSLDTDSGLEEVPTLDLDDGLDFDLDTAETDVPATQPEVLPELTDDALSGDDNSLDFDFSDAAEESVAEEADIPSLDETLADEGEADALEFDLGSLDTPLEETIADDPESPAAVEEDDMSLEFDLADAAPESGTEEESSDELSQLEGILDGGEASDGLPDLSFDMEGETGFAEAEQDDLQALESELDAIAGETAAEETAADENLDFSADLDELDSELTSLEEPESAPATEEEDIPLLAADDDLPVIGDDESSAGEIDLDELAAADDEFDFLAGTDECATKLDLARAYIDMEDFDGARELLQEVVQEGSDQQKTDARELMDGLS
ncbi:MAG: tetratricopeptide repeat protein [Pseudomonadota bacterium]|nr:tetratricopeptide repeat protein [Pseudomonadota bacterium]